MDLNAAPEVVKYLQRRFPSAAIPQSSWRAYAAAVAPFSDEHVRTAIDALSVSGERWLPNPGQVANMVGRLAVAAPEWDEVRRQLGRAVHRAAQYRNSFVWTCPQGACSGDGIVVNGREGGPCACRPAMIAARRGEDQLDPMVRAWLGEGYVTRDEVEGLVLEGDPFREAAMRKLWEAFAARAVQAWVLARLPRGHEIPGIAAAREESERHEIAAGRRHGAPALAAGPTGDGAGLLAAIGPAQGAAR